MKYTQLAVSICIVSITFQCWASENSVDEIFKHWTDLYYDVVPLGFRKECVEDPFLYLSPKERLTEYAECYKVIDSVSEKLAAEVEKFSNFPRCTNRVKDRILLDCFHEKIAEKGKLLKLEMDEMRKKVFLACCINAAIMRGHNYGEELLRVGVIKNEA